MSDATRNMITAIETTTGATEFVVGNEDINDVAQWWVDSGFTPESASEWWEAGCFDADRTAELRDAGLSPDEVSKEFPDLPGSSLGYAHSNLDVSTAAVVAACGK